MIMDVKYQSCFVLFMNIMFILLALGNYVFIFEFMLINLPCNSVISILIGSCDRNL